MELRSLKLVHVIHGARGVEAPSGFLTVVSVADEWTGEPENREPRKHSQVRWADVDAIPNAFVEITGDVLCRYLTDGCPSGGAGLSLAGGGSLRLPGAG